MGTGIDLGDLVRNAVAVVVATRDAELRPELSRAWGPCLSEDSTRLTMCVRAAPGSTMARNLELGNPVAASLARLTSHSTVQLKGTVVDVGTPTPEQLDAVHEHVEGFVAEAAEVGVPDAVARELVGTDLTDLMSVTLEVTARFDETPGPDAGRSL